MGEGVNKYLPPGGLIRWTIQAIDGMLRRHYGVVCYSDHPDCLLRISPGISDMNIMLSDGKQVWSYDIGKPVTSSPAVANQMVVVGSDDGYVYAFSSRQ